MWFSREKTEESGLGAQLIADPSHGHDQLRLGGILFNLLSQGMDVDIERVFFEGIAFSPHAVQHLLSRENAAWRFEEIPENLKLLWSEFDEFTVDPYLVT